MLCLKPHCLAKLWNAWAVNSSDHRTSGTAVQQNICRSAEIRRGVVVLWPIGMISGKSVWQSTRIKTVAHHSCSNRLQVPEMMEVALASGSLGWTGRWSWHSGGWHCQCHYWFLASKQLVGHVASYKLPPGVIHYPLPHCSWDQCTIKPSSILRCFLTLQNRQQDSGSCCLWLGIISLSCWYSGLLAALSHRSCRCIAGSGSELERALILAIEAAGLCWLSYSASESLIEGLLTGLQDYASDALWRCLWSTVWWSGNPSNKTWDIASEGFQLHLSVVYSRLRSMDCDQCSRWSVVGPLGIFYTW